jgi:hypothetical protein
MSMMHVSIIGSATFFVMVTAPLTYADVLSDGLVRDVRVITDRLSMRPAISTGDGRTVISTEDGYIFGSKVGQKAIE